MTALPTRALLLPLLCLALLAVPAAAQTATPSAPAPATAAVAPAKAKPDEIQSRLDSWKSEIEQISAGVQREGQSDRALADLRSRAEGIRTKAGEVEREETPRAVAVEARLKQLGPTPSVKEGEPEPVEADAVKSEREGQQKLLAEAQGRVKQAQVIQLRADEIVKAISEERRGRFARDMAQRSRSVLDPPLWLEALQSLPPILSSFGYLLGDWFRLLAARGLDTAMAVGSVIAALLGIGWRARRRLVQLTDRDPEAIDPPDLIRSLKAAGIIVVNFSGPVITLFGIVKALEVFDLNPSRIDAFLAAIIAGVASTAAVASLSFAILAPGKSQWRMAPVGDVTASRLVRILSTLAVVHGVGVTVVRLADVLAAPIGTLILFSGLFAVADAVLIILVLRRAARSLAGDEQSEEIAEAASEGRSSLWRWLLPFGWVLAIGVIVAAASGYVALAGFVTRQTIHTGILLGALYVFLILIDQAVLSIFEATSRFGHMMTRSMGLSRETLAQIGVVLSGLLRILAIAATALFTLAPLGVEGQDVVSDAKVAFFGFRVGGLTVSLSAILSGLVFLFAGIALTRGVQGWLDHRFLPRTRLDVGLKNSIRTSFGYVGTLVSVGLAFSVIGLDLQNLAIVAGALSVGVGFGLQSIVNNFVSGLILLAERPIKAGDLVEIGSEKGFVRKINVRSTEIETFDRASLIVPNSSLISGNVKNWMHRDLTGRCVVNIGVAYDADPAEVKAILLGVAETHDKVLRLPAPSVFFTNFGTDALEFRLICTVGAVTDAFAVESDLRFAIVGRLRELGIEIPYAQRDINIRQLGDLSELLQRFGIGAPGPKPSGREPSS